MTGFDANESEFSHVNFKTMVVKYVLHCCKLCFLFHSRYKTVQSSSSFNVSFRNDSFPAQWLSTAEISLGVTEWFMSTKRSITLIFTFNNRQQKKKKTAAPIHPGEKGRKGTSLTHSEQTSL